MLSPFLEPNVIIAVGRYVIVDMDFPEIFDYKSDRNAPMPTG
jgi:hypothetical protein